MYKSLFWGAIFKLSYPDQVSNNQYIPAVVFPHSNLLASLLAGLYAEFACEQRNDCKWCKLCTFSQFIFF